MVHLHTDRNAEGQGVVEFALILPLSLLVILAIVVFGIAFARMEAVENGAAEGGRAAQRWVPGGTMSCRQAVINAVNRTTPFDTMVEVDDPPCGDSANPIPTGELITVKVTHEYVPVFFGTMFQDMGSPSNSFDLQAEVTVMHE